MVSLISSRYFSNRYLMVASPLRPPRLYMSLVDHLECDSMEVCHNLNENALLSLSPSSSSNSVKSFNQDLTIPGMGGHNMVILRGLIFYIVCRKACIYNPTTRQSVTLPAVKSNIFDQEEFHKEATNLLGHDPVLDQYKIVCTVVICSEDTERITSEHWVFVLEAGGSWKKIEFDQPHIPLRPGRCINGVIYYLAYAGTSCDIVFSFDVKSEEFNMIQAPDDVRSPFGESAGVIEYGGKPAIFYHSDFLQNGLVDFWILEDGGKWSKRSLVLQPCQIHLLINWNMEGTTQNGEIILAPLPLLSPYYILYYNLHKNDLRKVDIRGIPEHLFGKPGNTLLIYCQLMDKNESIMHLEA